MKFYCELKLNFSLIFLNGDIYNVPIWRAYSHSFQFLNFSLLYENLKFFLKLIDIKNIYRERKNVFHFNFRNISRPLLTMGLMKPSATADCHAPHSSDTASADIIILIGDTFCRGIQVARLPCGPQPHEFQPFRLTSVVWPAMSLPSSTRSSYGRPLTSMADAINTTQHAQAKITEKCIFLCEISDKFNKEKNFQRMRGWKTSKCAFYRLKMRLGLL